MSSNHRLTDQVKLLQKAAIIHQDRLLILRRAEQSVTRPNQWDLPGGNSEWPVGEIGIVRDLHLLDLQREILEETGVEHAQFRTGPELLSLETCFEAGKNLYTIIVGWKIELQHSFNKESVIISGEHSEFAWIDHKKTTQYDFGFAGGEDGFITKIITTAFAHS